MEAWVRTCERANVPPPAGMLLEKAQDVDAQLAELRALLAEVEGQRNVLFAACEGIEAWMRSDASKEIADLAAAEFIAVVSVLEYVRSREALARARPGK
jgi:hypothetical protein